MKPDTLEKVLATISRNNPFEASIYFAKFDKTVNLNFDKEISNYDKQCIETFFNWGETLFTQLANASYEYYKDHEDACGGFDDLTINSPNEIWQHCEPINIHFVTCNKNPNSTFIDVELNCDWEPEHGMQWLLKNDNQIMYVGPYYGHARTDEKLGIDDANYA
jgi:hypothetical protein